MQPDLSKTKLRVYQYMYIDGTFEFIFGGFCLVLAGFFFIQAAMPEGLFSSLLTMSLIIITPAGAFLINRLVKHFKEQVTYPRTGFVALPPPKEGWRRGIRVGFMRGLAAILGGILAAFITRTSHILDWMPFLTGFVFGGVFFWIGFRSALPRFFVIALLLLLCGFGLTLLGMGDMPGLSLFYALSGLVLVFSGAYTLWRYLRRNPPTVGVTDES